MELDNSIPTTRETTETRTLLEAYAKSRRLKLADIVREALFEYIGSHNLKRQESKDEMPSV